LDDKPAMLDFDFKYRAVLKADKGCNTGKNKMRFVQTFKNIIKYKQNFFMKNQQRRYENLKIPL